MTHDSLFSQCVLYGNAQLSNSLRSSVFLLILSQILSLVFKMLDIQLKLTIFLQLSALKLFLLLLLESFS